LKQLYKDERLQFVSHLLAKEDDYTIDHATETAVHELISSGSVEELWDLFSNMDDVALKYLEKSSILISLIQVLLR
jgi:hypothetical protein